MGVLENEIKPIFVDRGNIRLLGQRHPGKIATHVCTVIARKFKVAGIV